MLWVLAQFTLYLFSGTVMKSLTNSRKMMHPIHTHTHTQYTPTHTQYTPTHTHTIHTHTHTQRDILQKHKSPLLRCAGGTILNRPSWMSLSLIHLIFVSLLACPVPRHRRPLMTPSAFHATMVTIQFVSDSGNQFNGTFICIIVNHVYKNGSNSV